MLTVLCMLSCWSWIAVSSGDFQLVLLHTNDVHARVEQTNEHSGTCSPRDQADDKCYGGAARMWTKIQELRQQYPDNSLLLDAGDQFQGTLWSNHYKGNESVFLMNYMRYDVMTLGNHDFDYGVETVRAYVDCLTFPVVVSNLDVGGFTLEGAYLPSHTFTINQRKIGVIGYISTNLGVLSRGDSALAATDEIQAVRKEASRLKSEGVHTIIALGHSGYDVDISVATQVAEVDVVIGGHSHTFLYRGEPPSSEVPRGEYPTVVERGSRGKALVVQAFAFSKYLGFLKVNFTDDGEVSSWEGQPILLDSSVQQDPELLKEISEMSLFLDNLRADVVGETYVFLGDPEGTWPVLAETNLGNLVTDAAVWSYVDGRRPEIPNNQTEAGWSDLAVALLNSGGIRAGIEQGPITMATILEVCSIPDHLVVIELLGSVLLEMLEHSAKSVDTTTVPTGAFLQMSGMRVTYDVARPRGDRVVQAMVRCTTCSVPQYKPLEGAAVYKVLVSSFMVDGGDGYSMLQKEDGKRPKMDYLVSDALRDYVQKFSPITHGLEGRIEYREETTL